MRNTPWVYGIVIFAGKETKLVQNSGTVTFKRTHLDKLLNVLVLTVSTLITIHSAIQDQQPTLDNFILMDIFFHFDIVSVHKNFTSTRSCKNMSRHKFRISSPKSNPQLYSIAQMEQKIEFEPT